MKVLLVAVGLVAGSLLTVGAFFARLLYDLHKHGSPIG